MKKFIILLFSIFLAMSLAACGNKTDSRDSSEKTEIKDAKELLMARNHMTEEEAHRYLQKTSMDSGTNLVETAQMVLSMMTE